MHTWGKQPPLYVWIRLFLWSRISPSNSQCEQSPHWCFGILIEALWWGLIPIKEADYGRDLSLILLSHCSFLPPSRSLCISFPRSFSLRSSVILMGWLGSEQWLPPCVISLTLPLLCHATVITVTCMRTPGRLNRFVKGPQWMRGVRASYRLVLVCASIPFWGTPHGGEPPASHPSHSSLLQWLPLLLLSFPPPHRDNQAYVKMTCSFDSHQLISDPIKPKSAIVRPSKCLKSACAGERGCALYPANHSWHSCHCCHGLGSEVMKTESMELTRGEWRSAKGGTLCAMAPLVNHRRG